MKIPRDSIITWMNDLLKPESFRDGCPNGLQVYGREQVERVATCVSVSEEFFERATDIAADLLLVHHGLFWEGTSRVVDTWLARRLLILLQKQTNLMAYHLPLDAHPELGNNAQLAKLLALEGLSFSFGHYKGMPIGCLGTLAKPLTLDQLADDLAARLGSAPLLFGSGSSRISRVGVVVGGAGDIPLLQEAARAGCDAYVTGVMFEHSVAIAREARLKVVSLGHYNSEKLGVRALGDALANHFRIEVVHMDIPNPV